MLAGSQNTDNVNLVVSTGGSIREYNVVEDLGVQNMATPKSISDIVIYDACLMASIEVAQVTAAVAKTMAGSADLEPGHGIDYAHLMSNISLSPPADGISFDKNRITYSVFDLSHVKSFSDTFKNFALEFKAILKQQSFLNSHRFI